MPTDAPAPEDAPALPTGRRDARLNRSRILESAREALEGDPTATMHAIARHAGVGQATMYRNFATREALIMAVHRHDVGELVGSAPELLSTHSPTKALRQWLEQLARYGRIKRGLAEALHTARYEELADEGYGPVVDAIQLILDAGHRAGELRADIPAEEVLLLVGFLWRLDLDDSWDARVDRMLTVVVDGLRTGRGGDGA